MDTAWYLYPLLVLAGFLAGFINTVAGYGSMITLSLLSFLGLPSTVANGTNRIGVLVQSLLGHITYQRKLSYSITEHWPIVVSSVVGAIVGAGLAVQLDEKIMDYVIGTLMVGLLITILLKPKQWLQSSKENLAQLSPKISILVFFGIGLYGGFIQAGVGVFLLAALVLGSGFSLVKANSIKIFIVLLYTIPALILFIYHQQVQWVYGGLMAIGQGCGAVLSARLATKSENASLWIRRLLIAIIIIAVIKFFNLVPHILNLVS